MVLKSLFTVLLLIATPLHAAAMGQYADSLPEDASEVCGITTEGSTLLLVFIGDGANAVCQDRANPDLVGPAGWSVVPDDTLGDLVAAQDSPRCTFHLVVPSLDPGVLTRVYALAPDSSADVICTGLTQFFPSVEATP